MRRLVHKFAIPCTALAVLLSPLANAADSAAGNAAGKALGDPPPGYEVVSRLVKFTDLNLADPKAVKTLYGRIRAAATEVCGPVNSRIIATDYRIRHCQQLAIAQAITDVNSHSLSSYYGVATNQAEFPQVR